MKRAIVFLAVALAIPTGVAAAKSPHANQGTLGRSAPKIMYILKGTLSAYTPAGASDGQISITVNHSNYHGRALKTKTLTFTLTAKTRVTFRPGTTPAQIEGARGMITVRAPKRVTGDLSAMLPGLATRLHVIVQKTTS